MKEFKEIMIKAQEKNINGQVWEQIQNKTENFLKEVSVNYPDKVKHFLHDLKDLVCFPPLSEDEAKKYVSAMQNKDGSIGGHWTLEQVRELAKSHPILTRFDCLDFYVAINMMYSDYYSSKRNAEDYVNLAVDFLDDKDAPHNKIRRYMSAMEA